MVLTATRQIAFSPLEKSDTLVPRAFHRQPEAGRKLTPVSRETSPAAPALVSVLFLLCSTAAQSWV